MSDKEQPERPMNTVLQRVSEILGEKPKILLQDSDSEEGPSPFVDPKAKDSSLFPQGRGNYQILGEVARGGMGIILRAHDTDLGRDLAIKVLDEKLLRNPAILHRFVEEAQIGGQLQHPGIVPVYEMGLMADDRPYFTMKFVKGRTLAALLAKRKTVESDRRRFLAIFEQVCQTVAYAHSKGVIHRDLKPANVMTGAFGEIQVVDWGLAKVLKGGGVADEMMAKQSQFTVIETVRSGPGSGGSDSVVGSVMGTPAYMAPEQAIGEIEKVDERADVFALGAILCEIITGDPPYVAAEKERTVMLAAHAKLDPARDRLANCSADAELKELCLECLAPAPAARLQNAEEVAQRIHDYLSSLEEKAHQTELAATEAREQRRRQRLTLSLAATVIIAVISIGFMLRRAEKLAESRRRQGIAQVQQTLDDASAKAGSLQDEGRFDEALAVAKTALLAVRADEQAEQPMIQRAERMVTVAESRVAEVARKLAVKEQNDTLLARCDELRMKQIEADFGFSPRDLDDRLEAGYVEAFRDYGVDLDDEDLPAALEVLRNNEIGVPAALAFDDWASVRRKRYPWDSYEVESILALAFDLDPDPMRTRMREALLANDPDTLVELARPESLGRMAPSTFWVLSQGLAYFRREEESLAVIRFGVKQHPADFLLNFRMGDKAYNNKAFPESMYYLTVAHSLRPDNAAVWSLMGDTYNSMGFDSAAYEAYASALRLDPELFRVHRFIGMFAFWSGHYEEAAASYDEANKRFPGDFEWQFEGDLARAFVGRHSLEDLAEDLKPGDRSQHSARVAMAYVVHPMPERRDPERALELIAPHLVGDSLFGGPFVTAARAKLMLGEASEALELAQRALDMDRPFTDKTEGMLYLVKALATFELGDRKLAKIYFDRAKWVLEDTLYDGWESVRGSIHEDFFSQVKERLGV